jgi:hypothetical protein
VSHANIAITRRDQEIAPETAFNSGPIVVQNEIKFFEVLLLFMLLDFKLNIAESE